MNSRERVLKTLHHQEPDRVPLYMTITPELAGSPLLQNSISFHEILTRLGSTLRENSDLSQRTGMQ